MDKKLFELLCCPVSKTPVQPLDANRIAALNTAITDGRVLSIDGSTVDEPVDGALLTDDGKVIYAIRGDIPVMLPESGIGTTQFDDFAAGRM